MTARIASALGTAVAAALTLCPMAAFGQSDSAPTRPRVTMLTPAPRPPATHTVLSNGLQLTTLPYGHTPKTLIQVVIGTGAEEPNQCGLTRVLAQMVGNGDAHLSGSRLTDSIAHMGGSLDASVRPEGIQLTLEVLSPYAVPAIELLGDIVQDPLLDSATTIAATRSVMHRAARTMTDIGSAATETMTTTLFPGGQFGYPCASPARIGQYSATDVRRFYALRVSAHHTRLYVVGRFDRRAVERAVARQFGGFPAYHTNEPLTSPAAPPQPAIVILQRPGNKQVSLVVGVRVPGPADSDYARLRIANEVLGGNLISRITTNIREAKGYAYFAGSDITAAPSGSAYWAEVTNVAAPVGWPALREIIKEIRRLGADPPADSELTGAQQFVVGQATVERASRAGQLEALETEDETATRHAGDDMHRMLAVTTSDVRRVVGTYMDPRNLSVVVAGDTTLMADQMADLRRGVDALRADSSAATH